jgi:colanic acid biosynthesis protein WcaH
LVLCTSHRPSSQSILRRDTPSVEGGRRAFLDVETELYASPGPLEQGSGAVVRDGVRAFNRSPTSAQLVMSEHGQLSEDKFAYIVRHAPLVSLDLIVREPEGRVLVGLRNNEPAKGCYFVPGGVIRKNETIEHAFARILHVETGCRAALNAARFRGAFQHFYSTNRLGEPGYGTHYVVLAYELRLDHRPAILLDSQHSNCKWMDELELIDAADVHENTKAYFR